MFTIATESQPRPGFSTDGCYVGSFIEQEAVFWLAEQTLDFDASDEVTKLMEDYGRACADLDYDAEAPARMRELNDQLQAAFARAARLVLN